ncbi:glycosyltransferase [Undibacterium sp. RTI2.1]|uniref:glycosyltransferase n=1 Tax=unclassified Undibacterium TaxID=2630295 RepID=UPI002B223635|nr:MULTISPECIES: glycosyltransferase [unclassified Undibacterium]MEB0029821.1 glycosyltransferase [Undibacterium sp. RTI2.1]MEB0115106.1 glycosyltransferase [Undibacterium sp. RTI2.2]
MNSVATIIPHVNHRSLEFSVVIPAYNAAKDVQRCLSSALNQTFDRDSYEVILVDDCSTDATFSIALDMAGNFSHLSVISAPENAGPGIARNIGIHHANGSWIIFLDSDDTLDLDALTTLKRLIDSQTNDLDIVAYNWAFDDSLSIPSTMLPTSGRRDQAAFKLNKRDLLSKYLSLHMDGSVIFTAIRRQLMMDHRLMFAAGYHEDVDYIYQAYWYARQIAYVDQVLYLKKWRAESIVNTISFKHIDGFIRAWNSIAEFSKLVHIDNWTELVSYYRQGTTGVVATRLREIYLRAGSPTQEAALYDYFFERIGANKEFAAVQTDLQNDLVLSQTKYGQIASHFMRMMQATNLSLVQRATSIHEFIDQMMNKSWSCIDLHHSVFLAPDQIRTCCKRFFVDGEIRGDVVLMDVPLGELIPVTPERILKAKRDLHTKINRAEASACDKCPFLEFKEWGALDKLDVRYLSFEYHSVCNLKCSYCSDTYYGGQQANYDVNRLLDKFLNSHALDQCGTIVWGGGEPVIGKDFDVMLDKTVERIPNAKQRVLTNAVKHNNTVQRLLAEKKVTVTTSIDAGTEATYTQVRGIASLLYKAMTNLHQYADADPSQVTVKYIFTEGNYSLDEVKAFVALVHEYKLTDCNFQISCDFKHETIALDAVISMIAMYGLLSDAHCPLVFFDDLLRQRLSDAHGESEQIIKQALQDLGLSHILADRSDYQSVAIWGAGWQSKYLIEKSAFFKDVDVAYFIDSRLSRIGEWYMGHEIVGPDTLLKSDIPVVIAAVQNLPLIYQSFLDLGIDESRLIKKLIF